jgi:hypothetical protein
MKDLPLLTLLYHPSGRRDLQRSKQRWEDEQHLQDQEQVLVDVNLNVQDDDDDGEEDKLLPEKCLLVAAGKHPSHLV